MVNFIRKKLTAEKYIFGELKIITQNYVEEYLEIKTVSFHYI